MLRKLKTGLVVCLLAALAAAQNPVNLTDKAAHELILASTGVKYTKYLTAITTSGVTITAIDTYVQLMFCTNTSGTSATLTVADTQGSPVTFWSTVQISANSVVLLHASTVGLFMQGIKLTAGTNSAISCQIQGVQANQ